MIGYVNIDLRIDMGAKQPQSREPAIAGKTAKRCDGTLFKSRVENLKYSSCILTAIEALKNLAVDSNEHQDCRDALVRICTSPDYSSALPHRIARSSLTCSLECSFLF